MSERPRIALVTGANGFIGSEVCRRLASEGWTVRRAVRTGAATDADTVTGMSLTVDTDWTPALAGVNAVVHCAAMVHRARGSQAKNANEYFDVNVAATLHLARSAANANVTTFVFLSSIAIFGTITDGRAPFSDREPPAPVSTYGHSKLAAEQALKQLAENTAMRLVIVRPPMVYGPNAPGSSRQLLAAIRRGIPLPFAAIRNKRSFIGIQNLASFVAFCLGRRQLSGAYTVADKETISTPDLIRRLGAAIGRSPRLFWFPVTLLRPLLKAINLHDPIAGSLEIDASRARQTGWAPELSLDEGLSAIATARH